MKVLMVIFALGMITLIIPITLLFFFEAEEVEISDGYVVYETYEGEVTSGPEEVIIGSHMFYFYHVEIEINHFIADTFTSVISSSNKWRRGDKVIFLSISTEKNNTVAQFVLSNN